METAQTAQGAANYPGRVISAQGSGMGLAQGMVNPAAPTGLVASTTARVRHLTERVQTITSYLVSHRDRLYGKVPPAPLSTQGNNALPGDFGALSESLDVLGRTIDDLDGLIGMLSVL